MVCLGGCCFCFFGFGVVLSVGGYFSYEVGGFYGFFLLFVPVAVCGVDVVVAVYFFEFYVCFFVCFYFFVGCLYCFWDIFHGGI